MITRGPLGLYLAPECWGYIKISGYLGFCRKIGQGQPRVIIRTKPQGHHSNKLSRTRALDAAYKLSRSSTFWFQRRIFHVFTIYGHGGHLGRVTGTIWANCRSHILQRLHMKFGFNRHSGFSGKELWKCWIWVALDQGQWMNLTIDTPSWYDWKIVESDVKPEFTHTWPLILIWAHVLIQLTASTNFDIIGHNSFWNIHCFTFLPYKSIRDQIWPCRKMCQGQPRVIVGINLVVLEHPMLHTKFQGHRPFGSGEAGFFKVFTVCGHGGHHGHVTWAVWTNFRRPVPRRLHMKFSFNRPSGLRGEDVRKCWYTYNTHAYTHNGRQRSTYPISSPLSLQVS